MKVHPCVNFNMGGAAYSQNFRGNEKSSKSSLDDYFLYMAKATDKDVGFSVLTGSTIAAFGSTKQFKETFVHNALRNVGGLIILMFGLRSFEYGILHKKQDV